MGRRREYANATERKAANRRKHRQDALDQIPQVHGDGYSVYQGDARQILPLLGRMDALITDPPYGVEFAYEGYVDSYANFCRLIVPILNASLDRVTRGAVFTGPHVHEQRKPSVLGGVYCPAGTGHDQWGFKTLHKVLFYGHQPKLHLGARGASVYRSAKSLAEQNGHPCPKPLEWMRWLVGRASLAGETVFDPFMGSGTTGVACLERGRRFLGIELDPGYFALACQRLEEGTRQGLLFGGGQAAD